VEMGFLESRWEEPPGAADAGRPRRRFYRVTVVGERAATEGAAEAARAGTRRAAAVART
jgi:DNA-binding PadR family transcriptional regulator